MNSIDTDSFVQKLKGYDEAFDFYMDYGKLPDSLPSGVNDNVKVYQKIIQKYTTSTECCKGTKSLLYITYC